MNPTDLLSKIAVVPDFPKPGIQFRDLTTLWRSPQDFQYLNAELSRYIPTTTTHLVGIESRGFILAAGIAQNLGLGLILARKPGKLPRPTQRHSYALEYGEDSIEVQTDDFNDHTQAFIVDDVLATGGTANAVAQLIVSLPGKFLGGIFVLEIEQLKGRAQIDYWQKCISLFKI